MGKPVLQCFLFNLKCILYCPHLQLIGTTSADKHDFNLAAHFKCISLSCAISLKVKNAKKHVYFFIFERYTIDLFDCWIGSSLPLATHRLQFWLELFTVSVLFYLLNSCYQELYPTCSVMSACYWQCFPPCFLLVCMYMYAVD